ncbi:DUF3644 domain-containing protein [Tetragenococcus halophilus]|uniref:DUF3644 domain-containing protein n=1 Tax=Tetragenococcus halophilus TaxID=51669 RepID=A0A3G5FIW0_TETHA|nr:DUF3644 domain-containing protein [Tetragenococcus halophilus]AYW50195.1 DUF3644 domain-containing protein [Tetragenococcus halophilus]QXN86326.1 DUF3644 domain-containing protein [Tetragenococcus halophilus]GBD63789.1 Uncharacterized protein TEHD23766T_1216 [Tetragenococcus halophilus subsp. flandriensis]GMG64224.1 DUF3644 domain-containing protein [Tetragenococcus halophilus]GMG68671.1 DUF3644 domain-containing protein [Tetragenococcus halophilus]
MENLKERLINKSIEAFTLAIETYNKPTISYRVEGFSFFICNAWELMLKAKLIKDNKPIYYKNSDRTLSLNSTLKLVYTDKYQPLRINLEKIIDLRNISTHLVTEDYESIYAPFFQANIINFAEQMQRFHSIDITNHISQSFLTLSVNMDILNNTEIRGKYSKELAEKLITQRNDLSSLEKSYQNNNLFIPIQNNVLITKDKNKADFNVNVSKDSDNNARIIKELQDPSKKYQLSFHGVINAVNKQLAAKSIEFNYRNTKGKCTFTSHTLSLINKFYNVKSEEKYCYIFGGIQRYSQQLVEFIIAEIRKDPDLIDNIKKANKKR